MIRPLRRRHLIIILLLIIILPILFIAGLSSRKPIAVMDSVPEPLSAEGVISHEP